MQAIKELLKQLAGIWNELGLNQKVTVMAAGFAVVAGLIAVIIWGGRTDYSLLYGNLDTAESNLSRLGRKYGRSPEVTTALGFLELRLGRCHTVQQRHCPAFPQLVDRVDFRFCARQE